MQLTKRDNKYINGKIYTIRSFQTDKMYIGSTYSELHKRLHKHRSAFKTYSVKNKYMSSFEILKYEDNYIELLELYPCHSKMELHRREGELIRLNRLNAVNMCIAGRTKKEYRDEPEHKAKMTEYCKIYHKQNNEIIKERHRQYHIENKEKICQKASLYYANNKKEVNAKRSEKITCECGQVIAKGGKTRHNKSISHQNFINNIVVVKVSKTDMIHCDCGADIQKMEKSRHNKTKKHQAYIQSNS